MSLTDEVQVALASIRKSLEAGRLAHAYLVVGNPRGGAGQLADEILSLLYCSASGKRPCRQCAGCRRIVQHVHPDLVWVEPQKRSRTIQKEQIQQIQQHVFQTSLEGGWKSVVLVHAERLNEIAANKLLKTLEEPPAQCLFLLLSGNPEFLLPTIVSRCQRMMLSGETSEDDEALKSAVVEMMTAVFEPGVAGGMMRARRMLDLLKTIRVQADAEEKSGVETEIQEKMGRMDAMESPQRGGRLDVDSAIRAEMADAVQARIESRYRERRSVLLRWLLFWYRDVFMYVCDLEPDTLYFREEAPRVRETATGLTYRQALANIRIVEEMKDQMEQALPEPMVLERGMIRLHYS